MLYTKFVNKYIVIPPSLIKFDAVNGSPNVNHICQVFYLKYIYPVYNFWLAV